MRRAIVIGMGVLALAGCQKKSETASVVERHETNVNLAAPAPPPMRKAGLWTQTLSSAGRTQTMKLCLDAAAAEEMQISNQGPQSNCAKARVTPAAGGFHFESTCETGAGGKTTSRGDVTGDLAIHYTVKVATETTGSSIAQANGKRKAAIEATWEGACPAGMKPGDMQLPNGMTINPASMGSTPKP